VRDAAEAGECTQADQDVYNEAGAVGVGSHLLSAIAEWSRVTRGDGNARKLWR
jgi:hypothetical protein